MTLERGTWSRGFLIAIAAVMVLVPVAGGIGPSHPTPSTPLFSGGGARSIEGLGSTSAGASSGPCTECTVATVTVGADPMGVAYDSAVGDVYVANNAGSSVSVISDATDAVVATVSVGSCPYDIAYDSSNGDLYATDSGCGWGDTVSVIDGATNTVVGSSIIVGQDPAGIAYDPGNGDLYVANSDPGPSTVSVISGTTNTVVATLPVGSDPYNIAYDGTNGDVYVTNTGSSNVSVIAGATNSVVASVPVGSSPIGIAFDPANGDLFATNFGSENISVISGAPNAAVAAVPLGTNPLGIAYDALTGDLYAEGCGTSSVYVVSGSQQAVVGTIGVGPSSPWSAGDAYDSGTAQIFVSNNDQGTVSVIETAPLVLDDVSVTSSNTTTLAGDSTAFTASVPGGAQSYTWNWGDGTTTISGTAGDRYVYADPGIYYVYVQARDAAGGLHDNLGNLLRFPVQYSYSDDLLGNLAEVDGSIVANTTSNVQAQAVIAPGGDVVVSNWVQSPPSNPEWTLGTPYYSVGATGLPYATLSQSIVGTTGLSGVTLSFSPRTPTGSYDLVFSVPTVDSQTTPVSTEWSNFTFTVFVGAGAAPAPAPVPVSPHPGTLEVYATGSMLTLDPAIEYDVEDLGVLQNVYQSLISFNGSQAGPNPQNFVPNLATCVPGSALCTRLYGSTLETASSYTFVIDPQAQFYNASSGVHYNVHPNDVAFSLARDCAYTNTPGSGSTAGWYLCQALLPAGNSNWDYGLHANYNNTPDNILQAITVNDSAYCTPTMMDGIHGAGCVTLNTSLSGQSWPEFIDFLAQVSGSGVVSCAWATAAGYGLPGWTSGTSCLPAPPGQAGNPNPVPGLTAWDNYTFQGTGDTRGGPPISQWPPLTPLTWNTFGSGPYAIQTLNPTSGLTLVANPYWGGTTCLGGPREGCMPVATPASGTPAYIPTVNVVFETNPGPGLSALASGQADLVDSGEPNGSALVGLFQHGEASIGVGPTIGVLGDTFALHYDPTEASWFLGFTPTLPAGALQDLNLRQFLLQAYPHLTTQAQDCLVQGEEYCFQFGGVIPAFTGPYYPTNVSWDLSDPDTNPSDVGSAAWWWAQVAADPIIGPQCTAATPCSFPIASTGNVSTPFYLAMQAWAQNIWSLSGGALVPHVVPIGGNQWIQWGLSQPPGQGPFPVDTSGWLPDYFDPSDYTDPYLLPNQVYTAPQGFGQYFPNYLASCAGTYTAPVVTQACQGSAYAAMTLLVQEADACALPACSLAQRELLYTMAEQIENNLGLDLDVQQEMQPFAFAPWIDPTTLAYNPMDDLNSVIAQPFYQLGYVATIPQGYPLEVSNPSSSTLARAGPLGGALLGATTVEVGQSLDLLVGVAGGSGHYRISWNGLPGCGGSGAAITCVPTTAGSFQVNATVRDSDGNVIGNTPITVDVLPGPSIGRFGSYPSSVLVGQTTHVGTRASGGTGFLRYSYFGLPPGCLSANATNITCTPSGAGSFTVTVSVTDALGVTVSAVALLTVAPSPPVILASVALSPSAVALAVGGSSSITASATGSNGAALTSGVAYAWNVFPAGLFTLSADTGPTVTLTAGANDGLGLVQVNVSYQGISLVDQAQVEVSGQVVLTLGSAILTPTTATIPAFSSQAFNATAIASGGGVLTSGVAYQWSTFPSELAVLNTTTGPSVKLSAAVPPGGPESGQVELEVNVSYAGVSLVEHASVTLVAPTVVALGSVVVTAGSDELLNSSSTRAGSSTSLHAIALDTSGNPVYGAKVVWSVATQGLASFNSTSGTVVTLFAGATVGPVLVEATAELAPSGGSASGYIALEIYAPAKAPSPTTNSTSSTSLFTPGNDLLVVGDGVLGAVAGFLIALVFLFPRGASRAPGRTEGTPRTDPRPKARGPSEGERERSPDPDGAAPDGLKSTAGSEP